MRLTLRTLLAYLDDRLSPGNARELGQKLSQSPFATELADRIRNVVRRRRLAADSGDHKNIDANLIAEYLDDQLTPELVALIEKEILGSDHSLAEVAASHQILGLLSDPVEISDRLRGRLHKLDPFVASKHEALAIAHAAETAEWKPLAPQAATSRRSPMLLLLLLVVGWLALLFSDANLFSSGDTEVAVQPAADQIPVDALNPDFAAPKLPDGVADNSAASAAIVPPSDTAAQALPAAPLSETVATVDPNVPTQPATSAEPAMANGAVPVVAANVPAVAPNTAAVASTADTVVADTVVADASAANANMQPTTPGIATDTAAAAVVADPAAKVQPVVTHVFEVRDKHWMHIMRDPETKLWDWAGSVGGAASTDWGQRLSDTISAIPTPFQAQVMSRDAGWMATVSGGSLFRAVGEDVTGLELFEGRVVLQRQGAGEGDSMVLIANGRPIMIAIPESAEDRIGVSVIPLPVNPLAAAPENSEDIFPFGGASMVTVFAADGAATFTISETEQVVTIDRGKAWQWNTSGAAPTEPSATAPQLIPEWVYQSTSPPADSTSVMMAEAAATFRSKTGVKEAAAVMSKDRNPQLAAYGVRLSSLINDVDQLMYYLLQPYEEVVRREAIMGLRRTIRQSDVGRKLVIQVLQNRLANTELDNAMKMLEGVSRTAAEDRLVSDWLVEMLSSNREALRAMAIENLEALTGERNGYSAEDDAGRRTVAIRRWERFVERNDGRLVSPK